MEEALSAGSGRAGNGEHVHSAASGREGEPWRRAYPTGGQIRWIKAEKNRILIVDDNKDLATSLARLLGLLGHEVEVVFDGRLVVETARATVLGWCLLDIGLPNLDGYQVARLLRQEGFDDAMIIAVSGYGQEEDRRRSREAGMDYHLTKPVDIKTITELIASGRLTAPSRQCPAGADAHDGLMAAMALRASARQALMSSSGLSGFSSYSMARQ